MRTDIPTAVSDQIATGAYSPATKVYAQKHLPEWSQASAVQSLNDNLMGHDCKHSSGYFYRVRSGNVASPNNNNLYFAKIADTANPNTWESSWVQVSGASVAQPSYYSSTAGAQVAIAVSGTTVRIFYFGATGALDGTRNQTLHDLYVIESTDGGSSWGSPTSIAKAEENALQVTAYSINGIYFTDYVNIFDPTTLVPYGYESNPASGVYGCVIRWARYSASWTVDDLNDWPLRGHWFLYRSARERGDILTADGDEDTWGAPVWAGLGVAQRPDGRKTVVSGGILSNAVGDGNHTQGLVVFTHDTTDNLWWHENTISLAEYAEDSTYWDVFARVANVNGKMVAIWQNEDEPTDVQQTDTYALVPRRTEVVYSYSPDGVLWTEPQALYSGSGAREVGSGQVILVGNTLYFITWYHVYTATVTHVFDSSAPRTEITDTVIGWSTHQTGRSPDTQMTLQVADPDTFAADPGDLITIEAGADISGTPTLATVGKGYLTTLDDAFSINERQKGIQVAAQMARPLAVTRSRDAIDILPQEMMLIEPTDVLSQLSYEWGDWDIRQADADFWSESSTVSSIFLGSDEQETFVEISTFDDKVQDLAWWHQVGFLTYPATMNGQFTAKMRMGLMGKDVAFYTGTKNFPNSIYCEYTNGFGDRWGVSGGAEADLDFCAGGIAFRGRDHMSTYVFAWEPGLRSWNMAAQPGNQSNGTCHPDTSFGWVVGGSTVAAYKRNPIRGSAYGSEAFGAYTIADMVGDNALVLYLFHHELEGEDRQQQHGAQKRYLLKRLGGHGLTRGNPVELHVATYYGSIYCYYRDLLTDQPWQLAFSYDAGVHLGAGRFGLYGRGYNGPEGSDAISLDMRNRTWFWDIRMANDTKNVTVADVVTDFAWKAGVETDIDTKIDSAPGAGLYTEVSANPVIDTEITLTAKAGFIVRASATNTGIALGVTPGNVGTGMLTLEVLDGGSVTKTLRRPTWFNIPSGKQLPMRFSAKDNWYSVWISDRLLGTFHFEYETGAQGIGGYGSGATYHSVEMSELHEVPQFAQLDISQNMLDGITRFLGQRRIKRFLTFDGILRLGYFLTHTDAGTANNTMIRNSVRTNDQALTHVRVQGGLGFAEYKSTNLNRGIRHFQELNLPDVMDRGVMYTEAQAILIESNELGIQSNFTGLPHFALEPEDKLTITVTAQSISGDFIVDDVTLSWGDNQLWQTIGTRQTYAE